jgi:hypothetical protein
MEPARLDPADPLASVLRWLAALAEALGIDLARPEWRGPLSRAAAAVLRGWLAGWSRQLRSVVRIEALLLARTLGLGAGRRAAGSRRPAPPRSARPDRRGVAWRAVFRSDQGSDRGPPVPPPARRRTRRPEPDVVLSPEEEAALQRRARAVLAALRAPGATVRRLAVRLAKRLAAARAAEAARRRRPQPPPTLGVAPRALDLAPEPRPPDRRDVRRPAARPAAPAAAPSALGRRRRLSPPRGGALVAERRRRVNPKAPAAWDIYAPPGFRGRQPAPRAAIQEPWKPAHRFFSPCRV